MGKNISLYPRYEHARNAAREFIIKSEIRAFPVELFSLFRKYGWVIKSVSELEALTGEIDLFSIRENPDCDAKTYLTSKGRYFIVYDDSVLTEGRILWTIAHEIGHIVLKHLEEYEQTEIHKGLTEEENYVLEKEADAFASEFLAASEILIHCKCLNKKTIMKLCGLSAEAAENKEKFLKTYRPDNKSQPLNARIYKQFHHYISNREYYKMIHSRICPVCKNYIFSKKERYCRICGNLITLRTAITGFVYKDGPQVDKDGRVVVCPKCRNSRIPKEAELCPECGFSLYNRCSAAISEICANKIHSGNARFCYECGSRTLFFKEKLLLDWHKTQGIETYRKEIKQSFENDKATGRIFLEWDYILSIIRRDQGDLYSLLSSSFAKLDYDTLFIYSFISNIESLLSDNNISDYIINLVKKEFGYDILEILPLVDNSIDLVAVDGD